MLCEKVSEIRKTLSTIDYTIHYYWSERYLKLGCPFCKQFPNFRARHKSHVNFRNVSLNRRVVANEVIQSFAHANDQ